MQNLLRTGSPFRPTVRLLSAGVLLATSATVAAQASLAAQSTRLARPYPDAVRGEEAVRELGSAAASLAAEHDLTAAALVDLLRRETSLWLAGGRLLYVDTAIPQRDEELALVPAGRQELTEEETFQLHSRPGAPRVVYLDFDGHHSNNNSWGHNIQFPAFDGDGDPLSFSESELQSIEGHFNRVSEDFAPFDVDVTTEEPPAGGLTKNGSGDTTWGMRCVMTQATAGFGDGIGGVAFLNSFDDSIDNPCFAFNKGINNGSMTASHEVGHTLGLSHDGLDGSEYHPGSGGSGQTSWGPIMGAPFGKNLVQWSDGSYTGATNTQNDYNIITKTANGIPFKTDDFSAPVPSTNAVFTFACPSLGSASVAGLIETRTDADTFVFQTDGGLVTVAAEPHPGGPNLDILLELYDDSGLLLASGNEIGLVDASIALDLPAGAYTIRLDGIERLPRYTDYGCIGQYTLTVSVPLWRDLSAGSGSGPVLIGSGSACELEPIELAVSGAQPDSLVLLCYGPGEVPRSFSSGVPVPDASRGGDIWALRTDASGSAGITRLWPAGMPSGTRVVFQAWTMGLGGPRSLSNSNAIAITAP